LSSDLNLPNVGGLIILAPKLYTVGMQSFCSWLILTSDYEGAGNCKGMIGTEKTVSADSVQN